MPAKKVTHFALTRHSNCRSEYLLAFIAGTKFFEFVLTKPEDAVLSLGSYISLGNATGTLVVGKLVHYREPTTLASLFSSYLHSQVVLNSTSEKDAAEKLVAMYNKNTKRANADSLFAVLGLLICEFRVGMGDLFVRCNDCQTFFTTKPAYKEPAPKCICGGGRAFVEEIDCAHSRRVLVVRRYIRAGDECPRHTRGLQYAGRFRTHTHTNTPSDRHTVSRPCS
jgi:hypothetical protein